MDPLTHVSLAACAAMAVSARPKRRAAGFAGALAGLLPDADVFIRSAADPLLAVEYHRHFTHAFAFQPLTALLALGIATALRRVAFGPNTPRAPFYAVLVAALTHPFCDWWTSYGTRVFWPFTQDRLALDWVSVIDPLVTLPLIVLGVWGAKRRSAALPMLALGCVAGYLFLATVQQQRATEHMQAEWQRAGLEPERMAVRPSFGNIVVWRAVWETDGELHCAMVRAGFDEVTHEPGPSAKAIRLDHPEWQTLAPEGSVLRRDLQRFAHFSDDWLILHPTEAGVMGDARYAMLPNEMAPLWGIRFEGVPADQHVSFEMFRGNPKERLGVLGAMIRGTYGDLPAVP